MSDMPRLTRMTFEHMGHAEISMPSGPGQALSLCSAHRSSATAKVGKINERSLENLAFRTRPLPR
jgi:hypothetical protein